MTCVIGLRRGRHVWIGADGIGVTSDGWDGVVSTNTAKVWKWGDFVFGSSGSYRAIQLVHRRLHEQDILAEYNYKGSAEEFMVCRMVPAIKALLEKHNFSEKKNERSVQRADFLVGVKNKLFLLQDEYAVLEISSPFYAIGCGKFIAIGAMDILIQNKKLTPESMIKRALVAAERHITTVGPFGKIVSTKGKS